MKVNSAIARVTRGGEPYAQWIRNVTANGDDVLFGSSVEEPVELLRGLIEGGFQTPMTPVYQSAFTGGNPRIVEHLSTKYGVTPAHLICTTGATSGLSLIYRTFLDPEDHILVEQPGFDLFRDIALGFGAQVDFFQRRAPNFDIDLAELARAITPRTKLIVLSNLHNPSGALLPEARLKELADLARARNLLIVVDEVYAEYAEVKARPGSAIRHGDNVIVVNSLTKVYGLSTLRCGWILGAPKVIAPIREVADHFEFGISKLAHSVAALVLQHSDQFDQFWKDALADARPIVAQTFAELQQDGLIAGDLPPFGCIAFPRLLGIEDTRAFSNWLAEAFSVVVAPGEFFSAPGHVRIGFAQPPQDLSRALGRFSAGLRAYPEQRPKGA